MSKKQAVSLASVNTSELPPEAGMETLFNYNQLQNYDDAVLSGLEIIEQLLELNATKQIELSEKDKASLLDTQSYLRKYLENEYIEND